jgi:predicted glutamine amidotransferase
MCRWLAYFGSPMPIEELLYKPAHSLIDQSLHSRLGAETTNGDGFGIGWYGDQSTPAVYHSIEPAWNERNPVEQTNCHPFRHDRWLWMHNGLIYDFPKLKRELVLAIDPALYQSIQGSTDSETLFFLALTLGLEDDPPAAVARAVGFVETASRRHGIEHPIQMTIATTNGEELWVFRYSSEGKSRSLFFSTAVETLRDLYPDNPLFRELDVETRLVVSEPLGELKGAWNEVPESSYGIVQPGRDELQRFTPVAA